MVKKRKKEGITCYFTVKIHKIPSMTKKVIRNFEVLNPFFSTKKVIRKFGPTKVVFRPPKLGAKYPPMTGRPRHKYTQRE